MVAGHSSYKYTCKLIQIKYTTIKEHSITVSKYNNTNDNNRAEQQDWCQ